MASRDRYSVAAMIAIGVATMVIGNWVIERFKSPADKNGTY